MTMQASHIDEWLSKAFELAYFLHGDRETAKTIALGAMAKLETASTAQFKRYYYTPTGRGQTARATRSRVSLNDLQLLQRLVFVESEKFEREKEGDENVCEKRLLTYFIKHLVRISLKRNSFYVTLGISRILHNYATVEAMEIYNVVVQNPDRVHDDYYYRSRKGVLMKELKARFGDLLDIVRGGRGEERFQTNSKSDEMSDMAHESLKFFTPWNSLCAIPDKFDPLADIIHPFHFDKDDPDAEHRIEVNRIHAALHPGCFDRLTGALNLASPKEKMEIPKFMITQSPAGMNNDNWGDPPQLETDELTTIKSILTAQAESRKSMATNFLRVIVDDREMAEINLDETGTAHINLDDSAELIEVRARGASGENIIATHLLSFDDIENGRNIFEVLSEGGPRVTFDLTPTTDEFGEIVSLSCDVAYAETAWNKQFALARRRARFAALEFLRRQERLLKPALTFGGILLTLSFGWFVYQRLADDPRQAVVLPVVEGPGDQASPNNNTRDPQDNSIAPGNTPDVPRRQNGVTTANERELRQLRVSDKPVKKGVVPGPGKELQANNQTPQKYREYTDENAISRLPIRETRQTGRDESDRTRAVSASKSLALAQIDVVYIEMTGDAGFGIEIKDKVAAEIRASGSLKITTDKQAADALLKIHVRHESDASTRGEATLAVVVSMSNAKGFVIYPDVKRVSGWKYVGTAAKLPALIARDLLTTAAAARSR